MKIETIQPLNFSTVHRIKAAAFTLAETLIVIGIIGVVAALTLPNLNHATGDKETVTRLQKTYSTLVEAYDRAEAIYGPVETWFNDMNQEEYVDGMIQERFANRLAEFLKTKKTNISKDNIDEQEIYLGDGAVVLSTWNDGFPANRELNSVSSYPGQKFYFCIDIDINGDKGKNRKGYDRFTFVVTDKGILHDDTEYRINTLGLTGPCVYQRYCTAWVLMNGNLDYLKLDSEGNCPDGKPLDWNTKTNCN